MSPTVVRGSCIVALSMLLTGCTTFTEPTDDRRLSLVLQQPDDRGIIAPVADVRAGDVVLRGTFSTPCLGYAVTAGATQRRETVDVTLRGRKQGEICLTAIGRFPYTATVSGVTAGTRRVIVRHVIEDANWPAETVIDTMLRVP